MNEARAQGPVIDVDAGQSLTKLRMAEAERDQARDKAAVMAAVLADAKLDAMAVGPAEWTLGVAELRAMVARTGLPVLAANLTCDGAAPFPASTVVERGGVTVLIAAVTAGEVPGCVVTDAALALESVRAAHPDVDLALALLPMEARDTKRVLPAAGAWDLAVDATRSRLDGVPEQIGPAWVVGSGPRGQRVGLTDVVLKPGGSGFVVEGADKAMRDKLASSRTRLESLEARAEGAAKGRYDKAIANVRADVERLEAMLATVDEPGAVRHELSQRLVELDDAVADEPTAKARIDHLLATMDTVSPKARAALELPRLAPGRSAYQGAATCKSCHETIYRQWLTTGHASAWETLVDEGKVADASCPACHATAVGTGHGPTTPDTVGGLRDVQCEACHGPARAHARQPQQDHPELVKAPGLSVCTGCHDGEQDMGQFDPASYMPKVNHSSIGAPAK